MTRLILILGLVAAAQAATVKGVVREIPHNAPIAGVQVTLGELLGKALATTYTGNDGTYEFRSVPPGDYTVDVAKAGYWWSDGKREMLETGGLGARVPDDGATIVRDIAMARPATLSGRVIDEDGNPIAGRKVALGRPTGFGFRATSVATDAEGRFAFRKLIAGRYVVRIDPPRDPWVPVHDFTAADVSKIDEDYPVSYWPGGSANPAGVLAATLPPGGNVDIGDLRPRKFPLYRMLVRLLDESCEGNVRLTLQQIDIATNTYPPSYGMPCATQYLFTGLAAGRWRLSIAEERRWGIVEFRTGPEERPVEMRLQDTVTPTGRVVGAEGVKLDKTLRGRITLLPEGPGVPAGVGEAADARFTISDVFGVPYLVRAQFTPPSFYAAEIRYGGRPAPDGVITPIAGGEIEVVVDDKPGAISGSYRGGDGSPVTVYVFQPRNGRLLEAGPRTAGREGQFTVANLAPGTYQIHAVQQSTVSQGEALDMETVIVRRGETTKVSLPVQ